MTDPLKPCQQAIEYLRKHIGKDYLNNKQRIEIESAHTALAVLEEYIRTPVPQEAKSRTGHPDDKPQLWVGYQEALSEAISSQAPLRDEDVEALKKYPDTLPLPPLPIGGKYTYTLGWNDCLDHLHKQGLLRAKGV